MNKDTNTFSVF